MKIEHLSRCQVETPAPIVELLWRLALEHRQHQPFARVIDLGAGDGRFSHAQHAYEAYLGLEFDKKKVRSAIVPAGARLKVADALAWTGHDFDLCIGNPPYIRHHNLSSNWREKVLKKFDRDAGIRPKKTANLFVLFLIQALMCTADDGLVVQLVPFEWVTRPSAKELRDLIEKNGWSVSVYRFNSEIFPRVLTTASVTIIDKKSKSSTWKFGEIGKDGKISPLSQPSGSTRTVLPYVGRSSSFFALRGLSPGGQDIFVLTEEERLHFGLQRRRDVVPCVTTLRHVPEGSTSLDESSFRAHYIDAGKRCWLIRSDKSDVSEELKVYLERVGDRWKSYSTCTNRSDWWRYKPHPKPRLLFSSGFVGARSKVLINEVGAIAVGAVYGIMAAKKSERAVATLASRLRHYDLAPRVVSHSNNLKKIEVKQLNAVLTEIAFSR